MITTLVLGNVAYIAPRLIDYFSKDQEIGMPDAVNRIREKLNPIRVAIINKIGVERAGYIGFILKYAFVLFNISFAVTALKFMAYDTLLYQTVVFGILFGINSLYFLFDRLARV